MLYPTSPQNVSSEVTNPSKQFLAETYKVSLSIVGFILIYLILFFIVLVLAFAAVYIAYSLVAAHFGLITIFIAIALSVFSLFIVLFLLKFITSKNKHDTSHLKEVKADAEPQLFEFIEKVVTEVGSSSPKKVFLSNEVNAYVFYNSNFWSLFFPVKKNLVIGLGLINSINLSEFKAILAHEFGHFSQKSMKLGSYIYYVNKVIYDMLYNNENYENAVIKMSESNGYFSLAGWLTFAVIKFIQAVLRLVYKPINVMYMALSRQMEFHADAISASVTGGNHLISSLERIEMSVTCFNELMSKYHNWGVDKVQSENIYENHRVIQQHFANEHGLKFENDLIKIDKSLDFTNEPRIKIKDQWASHPSFEQRTEHLNRLNLTTTALSVSPWKLFKDAGQTQIAFSKYLFEHQKVEVVQLLDNNQFKEKYFKEYNELIFPKAYNGFFNSYFPTNIALELIAVKKERLDELLSKTYVNSLLKRRSVYNDLNLIYAIKEKQIKVKTFDFDGKKYKSKNAEKIYHLLNKDSDKLIQEYREAAKQIFSFFYHKADNNNLGKIYKQKYEVLIAELKEIDQQFELIDNIRNNVAPIFEGNMSIEDAHDLNQSIKNYEVKIKEKIRAAIKAQQIDESAYATYMNKSLNYFSIDTFNEPNLELLIESIYNYEKAINQRAIKLKRDFLVYQLEL